MFNLLKKSTMGCERFRDGLELAAETLAGAESPDVVLSMMKTELRAHGANCADCRTASAELLSVRAMMKDMGAGTDATADNPWFAGRVMALIAAREVELNGPVGTWIALPKLASRFALVAGAIILVGSTWLFQRPGGAQKNQSKVSAGPEYLFEAPPPAMTQDDVLVSLAENNE